MQHSKVTGGGRWVRALFGAIFTTVAVLGAPSVSFAVQGPPGVRAAPTIAVIPVSRQTLPPFAHARFCVVFPEECVPRAARGRNRTMGLKELQRVNLDINLRISPRADEGDDWTLADGQGDCEDYALLKRKVLLERGWSSRQLRIATALTQDGVGHAVLVARFQGQDYVLDNLNGVLRLWHETGYQFTKIQSEKDPKVWYAVAQPSAPQASLS